MALLDCAASLVVPTPLPLALPRLDLACRAWRGRWEARPWALNTCTGGSQRSIGLIVVYTPSSLQLFSALFSTLGHFLDKELSTPFTFCWKIIGCFELTEASWHRVMGEEGGLMLQTCHFLISEKISWGK